MKKEYVSPLFEEIVLMTEDVLSTSDYDVQGEDNVFDTNTGDNEGQF